MKWAGFVILCIFLSYSECGLIHHHDLDSSSEEEWLGTDDDFVPGPEIVAVDDSFEPDFSEEIVGGLPPPQWKAFQEVYLPGIVLQPVEDIPSLPELWTEFIAFFDGDVIDQFIDLKNRTDPDAAQLLWDTEKYLQSQNASIIVTAFWNDLEFQDAIFYLYANGLVEIYDKINDIHRRYGWELVGPPPTEYIPFPKRTESVELTGKSVRLGRRAPALFQEFLDMLHLEDVRLFFHRHYETDALQNLYKRFSNSNFGEHYREFKKLPELNSLGESMAEAGFELESLRKIVEVCMTWQNHSSVGLSLPGHGHHGVVETKIVDADNY